MRVLTLSLLSAAAAVGVTSAVHSHSSGVLPGEVGIPMDVTRQAPACGQCHRAFPGGLNLQVSLTPTKRILALGEAIQATTQATGGPAGTRGGFVVEATAGTLSPGSNARASANGRFLTHNTALSNRTWTYGYTAPAAPGLVELYTVVNAVDGSGTTLGDYWAFHGFNAASAFCTPVRLYVNAVGVAAAGAACVGSWGQYPVFGSKATPSVGNAGFGFELFGAAPAAPFVMLLNAKTAFAGLDLGLIGITGCTLLVDPANSLALSGTTSNGDLFRAEGAASISLPLPNDANLRGAKLMFQVAILDTNNGRPTPITMTNGLEVTIQ